MFFSFISIDFIQKVQTKIVMETSNSQCRVRQCFYCENDTQFFCAFCSRDFCARCQEIHSTNMSVNYHDVVIYREKLRIFSKDEVCTIHPDGYSKFYCETCELPICNLCTSHRQHLSQDARTAYKNIAISVKIAFALSEMTLSLTDMFYCQESVWILKLVMHFFLKFKQSL